MNSSGYNYYQSSNTYQDPYAAYPYHEVLPQASYSNLDALYYALDKTLGANTYSLNVSMPKFILPMSRTKVVRSIIQEFQVRC